jgi:hypothetical protein
MAAGKNRVYDGVVNSCPGVDLILFDCPENLPVPEISFPMHAIPPWNSDEECEALNNVFLFAEKHLQDHGCLIVFHSRCGASKSNIAGLCLLYPTLVEKEDWLGMNRMHLTSPLDKTTTVRFWEKLKTCLVLDIFSSVIISNVLKFSMLADIEVRNHRLGEEYYQEKESRVRIQKVQGNGEGKS